MQCINTGDQYECWSDSHLNEIPQLAKAAYKYSVSLSSLSLFESPTAKAIYETVAYG